LPPSIRRDYACKCGLSNLDKIRHIFVLFSC